MKLGIGGGAFGFRGGVSTRGAGVGVGPFSAGTSWRGGRSRSGGGGGVVWVIAIGLVLFLALWPYLLGTFIAVQCGAWNPSTTRFVVGWCFEVVYIATLVAAYISSRHQGVQRAAEETQRMAALTASGAVYEVKRARSVIYRHGTCTVSHRSSETAERCGRSTTPAAGYSTGEIPASGNSAADYPRTNRLDFAWPAAILVVGLIIGLAIFVADPIHSPAGDAAAKPCPGQTVATGTVAMPGLVGLNAGDVESQLKSLGINSVALSSANANYKSVWKASNWTVVSTDPGPGCMISPHYPVTVYVTK
ncbi:Stk1 family PASTA domain-containing Ser/Thr kinase [Mycobacteroides abscessus]|uniref:Stk1 family PASTA domain-containing Ser/Thr kinase n=1 Tax=Mycobacteroides abscessus TaxID=36809 RepID=UPI0012FFEED7|nr:PASTA domain-containing protein [Mycobacteroides abscessus]